MLHAPLKLICQKPVTVLLLVLSIIVIMPKNSARAVIQAVTVTPAAPTLVKGNPYYLPGIQYEFRVQVIEPNDTDRTYYDNVTVAIPINGTTTVTATWTAPGAANGFGSFAVTDDSGSPGNSSIETAGAGNVSGTVNLDLRFRITLAWDINGTTGISAIPAVRTISVNATSDAGAYPGNPVSTLSNYGFCNQVQVYSMAQSGDAADGMLNPHYDVADGSFNVTGTLVYNIPGVDATDAVPDADIGNIYLYEDTDNNGTVDTGILSTDGGATSDISLSLNYNYLNTSNHALGTTYWRCQAVLTNPDASTATLPCQTSLALSINRVLVTDITVDQGGGRDNVNYHWRSTMVTGTRFTLTAEMQDGSGTMTGDTTFYLNYNGAPDNTTQFSITIASGQTSASVIIPPGNTPTIAAGSSTLHAYHVTQITGNSYGDQGDGVAAAIATTPNEIVDPGNYASGSYYTAQNVHWENADAPPITTDEFTTSSFSATTATLSWDNSGLDVSDTSADGDFYEYRVYYRLSGSGSTFSQWDGDEDAALRGTAAAATTTVTNLNIFTEYEYYLVSVDLFGNESLVEDEAGSVVPPGSYSTFRTSPYSIEVTVSDGITSYANSAFPPASTPGDYITRPLSVTAIKVEITIVTSGENPDSVVVWYTNNLAIDIVTAVPDINSAAFIAPTNYLLSETATKSGPNKWVAYLPTTSIIITQGNFIRFIIETEKDGTKAFSDINSGTDTNPNNNEWAFDFPAAGTVLQFQPWPTRILNNVMTKSNPTAYPAYYLSDDANVTIKVYDIKGRPVITLLENAPRLGGQNIKDQGWSGTNKSGRKIGKGLYIIHIRAKRTSDGKVILNKFNKVLMKR